MKNNKKGFTLIELLAVIVILAIIMVIAVPQILGVIDSSRTSAWDNNVKLIARSIETHESIVSVDSTAGTSLLSSTGCTESAVKAAADIADDTTISATGSTGTCTVNVSGTPNKQFDDRQPKTVTCTASGCTITNAPAQSGD